MIKWMLTWIMLELKAIISILWVRKREQNLLKSVK